MRRSGAETATETSLQNLEVDAAKTMGGFDIKVVVGVVSYCLCSSTMLLVNKMAMRYVPVASLVNVLQMAFAVVIVYTIKFANVAKVDDFEMSKVKAYAVYSGGFALGIYCNMQALSMSNVETIIVFRSCCPLAVSFLEYLFLGRQFPGPRCRFFFA